MGRSSLDRPLRVCHLGKFYPPAPGGIETHVRTLAQAQTALGLEVSVLCINHLDRRGIDATWARYGTTSTIREVDRGVRVTRVGRSMTFARVDFCPELPRIIRAINRDPPDIYHLHTPNVTMLLGVAVLTSANVPLVITHHSDIVRQRVRRWAFTPYERRVYRRAAAIVVASEAYAQGSELLQAHRQRVVCVPMGLDLSPFVEPTESALNEQARLEEQFRDRGPLWLAVGRCVYYKGFEHAIRALQHVPGTLWIIGRGPLEVALRRLAERLGVSDRILWEAYASQDRLVAAYRVARALWFPSNARSEAYGLVQIEAMASGCPVINTDVPHSGVNWVSPHEQSGITVPVNDPAALAAAALRLLNEPGLYERLSIGGRRRAQSEFGHAKMAERCAAVYESVLARNMNVEPGRLARWVRDQIQNNNHQSINVGHS